MSTKKLLSTVTVIFALGMAVAASSAQAAAYDPFMVRDPISFYQWSCVWVKDVGQTQDLIVCVNYLNPDKSYIVRCLNSDCSQAVVDPLEGDATGANDLQVAITNRGAYRQIRPRPALSVSTGLFPTIPTGYKTYVQHPNPLNGFLQITFHVGGDATTQPSSMVVNWGDGVTETTPAWSPNTDHMMSHYFPYNTGHLCIGKVYPSSDPSKSMSYYIVH